MKEFLDTIRKPTRSVTLKEAVIHTAVLTGAGLLTGVVIKLLDIYTQNLGNVFSQMSVWILICTVISVCSSTPRRAAVNVFCFCAGMLLTYYAVAELTDSVYSMTFVYGWAVFALFSPVMGFCVWYAKGSGAAPKVISVGIIVMMLLIAAVMFDRIRIADILIAIVTGVFLFRKNGVDKARHK